MARKKLQPAEPGTDIQIAEKTPQAIAEREAQVHAADAAIAKLASSIGYAGALDTESLWGVYEHRQRRSVDDILTMGRALLLIKEQTPHGDFLQQCEARGTHRRTAQRFMSVALKFSKSDSVSLLKAAGSQAKVLELAVLDDDELAALESGESVAGITLDDVERMGASQLRQALRDARADIDAKDDRAAKRERDIEKLQKQLRQAKLERQRATPAETQAVLRDRVTSALLQVRADISAHGEDADSLFERFSELRAHAVDAGDADSSGDEHDQYMAGIIGELMGELRRVRDAFGLPIVNDHGAPSWAQGE
jgi:hypothetical protein